ncbi:MAG: sigma 54-interacting transcriptional regulator [Chromatiales bacterium]|nr:sigma 54-interacting transcriptional regulator [Chromatiales bacterium]
MTVATVSKKEQVEDVKPVSTQPNWGQIFAAIPDAVVVLDGKGIVAKANESAFQLLNHELIGHAWPQIIQQIFQPTCLDGTPLKLRDGRPVSLLTEPFKSGSGQLLIVREALNTTPKSPDAAVNRKGKRFSHKVVAEAPSSIALLELARRVAQSSVTVMITGESGTGKEVIARYIHDQSQRADKPFVAINCAAIPETMLEATLFGYEKGAFTGAMKATPGKFEQANGGTLLLDEVSEMDLGLQAKLLRVLQEREVERLGSTRTTPLDVRILATSNRDMRQQVDEGKFREDLYYRLIVFPLHLQPLRDRPLDIAPIAQISLKRALESMGGATESTEKILSSTAIEMLNSYQWPGNIRELDNVMQRAVILSLGDRISGDDIQFDGELQSELPERVTPQSPQDSIASQDLGQDMQQQEYLLIQKALTQGSRKAAAENLAVSERTLRYKIAKLREAGFKFD